MIKHCVLLKFNEETTHEAIDEIFKALAGLRSKCPGLIDFAGGVYSSPEGLNQGFTHGFVMTFDSSHDRDIYLDHPDHEVVKRMIQPHLEGGLDGVIAFDFAA